MNWLKSYACIKKRLLSYYWFSPLFPQVSVLWEDSECIWLNVSQGTLVFLAQYAKYMDVKTLHSLVKPSIPVADKTSVPVNSRFECLWTVRIPWQGIFFSTVNQICGTRLSCSRFFTSSTNCTDFLCLCMERAATVGSHYRILFQAHF